MTTPTTYEHGGCLTEHRTYEGAEGCARRRRGDRIVKFNPDIVPRCVLCRTEQPDLNRHGECVECVDAAEGTSGF